MLFTLLQAAKETGSSKSTISKALSSGRSSGERLDDGSFWIEAAELFRVFPRRTEQTGLPETPVPFANSLPMRANAMCWPMNCFGSASKCSRSN